MRKNKWVLASMVLAAGLALVGCGESTGSKEKTTAAAGEGSDKNISCTLTLATWDVTAARTFDELDLEGRFQELYPNVEIDIEEFSAEPEYFNSMKIRSSASELPDLMFHKSDSMYQYEEYLTDLTDTEANKNNQIAAEYMVNGRVLGVPDRKTNDYVFYWVDMFEEAGVEVPDTWGEFVEVSEKLQAYFGAKDPDYSAISMGAKESWTTYPFMEYGPAAESGNGYYWDSMTEEDKPFAEGTAIHTVYGKVYDLFGKGVFGKDPLGITSDQSKELFAKRKGTMTLSSPMFLSDYKADGYDPSGIETFYLPFRDDDSSEFNLVTQGDCFLSVTEHSENPEVAKAFLEFYFSEAWYPDYINHISSDSTMMPFHKELDEVLMTAPELQPDVVYVTYGAGKSDFINMVSETKFDCKELGAEMLTEGFDFNRRMEELNQSWTDARKKLNLQ
jgi:raffinose/stachyose/melibiose transport system substrate-binding protein